MDSKMDSKRWPRRSKMGPRWVKMRPRREKMPRWAKMMPRHEKMSPKNVAIAGRFAVFANLERFRGVVEQKWNK